MRNALCWLKPVSRQCHLHPLFFSLPILTLILLCSTDQYHFNVLGVNHSLLSLFLPILTLISCILSLFSTRSYHRSLTSCLHYLPSSCLNSLTILLILLIASKTVFRRNVLTWIQVSKLPEIRNYSSSLTNWIGSKVRKLSSKLQDTIHLQSLPKHPSLISHCYWLTTLEPSLDCIIFCTHCWSLLLYGMLHQTRYLEIHLFAELLLVGRLGFLNLGGRFRVGAE